MTARARLLDVDVPARPDGVVLVLHGGASRRRDAAVSPTQLSVLRMLPIASRIARAGGGRLAVLRLLNSSRGWQGTRSPVDDVDWALDELAARFGRWHPTCLVGHSLGGRAALFAADRPEVRSAVALAPWVYPDDDPRPPADRRILVVHGAEDRIADPEHSRAVAERMARRCPVGFVSVPGGTHAMLRHRRRFDTPAADFAAATLLGAPADGALGRVLGGARWVEA